MEIKFIKLSKLDKKVDANKQDILHHFDLKRAVKLHTEPKTAS